MPQTGPSCRGSRSTSDPPRTVRRVDLEPVRAAYGGVLDRYVALADDAAAAPGADAEFVRRHLTGLPGPVLDLGCGPGHRTADLRAHGADVVGVDLVPEFVAHARAAWPGTTFRVGAMTEVDVPAHSVAGVLSWYSTIHVPPGELADVFAAFRRLLAPAGVLVVGFFAGDDAVARFDHAVLAAYRWPVDVLADLLVAAGFSEVERVVPYPPTPDRRYAAIAARVT